jgi:hypothetical protein
MIKTISEIDGVVHWFVIAITGKPAARGYRE